MELSASLIIAAAAALSGSPGMAPRHPLASYCFIMFAPAGIVIASS